MPRQSIFDMKVSKVYPLLVQKAERKGRTKDEVDQVTAWLTGYDMKTAGIASRFLCTGLRRKTYAGAATGIPAKQDEKRLKSLYASG